MDSRLALALVAALMLTACGDDDGRTEPDLGPANDLGAPMDAAEPADAGSTGGCVTDDDCRRFRSTCEGCECLPLLESEPDPVCEGMMVSCLVDPCETAGAVRCDTATGACELE